MELENSDRAPLGFGGKGQSLRWLSANGFPCPAFDLLDAGLWISLLDEQALGRALQTVRFGTDQLSFSLACHQLREAIAKAELPEQVKKWLASAPLERLGHIVAVRSSALSEDGASASSAGQYESVLGVADEHALETALRAVLASYYGERAALYRRVKGIGEEHPLAMGLIVQDLVVAEVAGIAFSRDPVSGHPDPVIEASWGLGPPVVSGETQPDHFRLLGDGDGTKVIVNVGRKQRTLHFDRTLGRLHEGHRDAAIEPCIEHDRVVEIGSAVKEMEALRGVPVDVEWAIADNELSFLQIRPVTTAAPSEPTGLMAAY
jgi:phosphoenolpyruvate synthase/pyruvate phosphate dikinase